MPTAGGGSEKLQELLGGDRTRPEEHVRGRRDHPLPNALASVAVLHEGPVSRVAVGNEELPIPRERELGVARRDAVITDGDVGLRAATDDEARAAHAAARTGRAVAAKLARDG